MHSAQDIVGCISAMLNITGFDVHTKDGTSSNDVGGEFGDKDKCKGIAVPSDILIAKKETKLQMERRLGRTNVAMAARSKLDNVSLMLWLRPCLRAIYSSVLASVSLASVSLASEIPK